MSKQNAGTAAERSTQVATSVSTPQPVLSTTRVAVKRVPQDVEVVPKARRRRFTAEYKREILKKADACQGDGDVGMLLRMEGLYSSHLTGWRREREARELAALAPKKRGRKTKLTDAERENAELRKENAKLRLRAERAELVAEIEKKVSRLVATMTPDDEEHA